MQLSPTMKKVILHMYKHGDTGFGGGDEIATSATCAALHRRGLIEPGICNEWGNHNWYTYHLNESGRRIAESLMGTTPAAIKRTIKDFEMAVTSTSSDEWDRQALEAQEARARIRAEYEAEQLAKYDAGLLVIGCDPNPKQTQIYGRRGIDREIWGTKISTLDAQADRAYSINW